MSGLRRADVAAMVEHTLLKPEALAEHAAQTVAEAQALGVLGVCLSPSVLPVEAQGLVLVTVVGFPSGRHHAEIKAAEAALAARQGAQEIDMVVDLSNPLVGDYESVEREVALVRAACGDALLKVIIESEALLTLAPDGASAVTETSRAVERGGAEFVKTSTGFHPAGGASVAAVSLMSAAVSSRVRVKASGGIRTAEQARALIEAGAHRLGLSGSRAVLDGFPV
ncbi:deoxyribose-phosphate aldolase [Segniliparus rugosus ATCC BAA-974]|uniref:Deoxyribose-phosphate aldolase n=2 Tax=Segniliparus rugosus TaxID=286804 RepID=E5XTD4_SEGRC|nr:deoxyribose-phosphate aldolase [Segniliparus rugosus ATCC BAA-974]